MLGVEIKEDVATTKWIECLSRNFLFTSPNVLIAEN